MRAIIRTMGFVYVYSNLAIVFPFMLLRYIALHEWTTQLVWLPWFDAVLPPANHRELTFVENDKIAIIYLGVSVLNAFNQTLNFFCDRDEYLIGYWTRQILFPNDPMPEKGLIGLSLMRRRQIRVRKDCRRE